MFFLNSQAAIHKCRLADPRDRVITFACINAFPFIQCSLPRPTFRASEHRSLFSSSESGLISRGWSSGIHFSLCFSEVLRYVFINHDCHLSLPLPAALAANVIG